MSLKRFEHTGNDRKWLNFRNRGSPRRPLTYSWCKTHENVLGAAYFVQRAQGIRCAPFRDFTAAAETSQALLTKQDKDRRDLQSVCSTRPSDGFGLPLTLLCAALRPAWSSRAHDGVLRALGWLHERTARTAQPGVGCASPQNYLPSAGAEMAGPRAVPDFGQASLWCTANGPPWVQKDARTARRTPRA